MSKKHQDTSISLHPLSFEEAIEELASPPKRKDSQAERSDNTTEPSPESAPVKKKPPVGPGVPYTLRYLVSDNAHFGTHPIQRKAPEA